ncbi:hypothetical protein WICPIJ_000527 [Wickerhamomyces pijperi]|uniref:NAD(P)-binding domain-containing protein n=1 Tax=Wickerhamomyces pijperi TaxID=599730 RepID=A0A9P8TRX9_WICPI|nr:hypothetical protein WICPIJ_000527 [Wickerhamomyces pijperi]
MSSFTDLKVLVIGGTGLLGSNFVCQCSQSSKVSKVIVLARRSFPKFANMSKVEMIVNKDTSQWSNLIYDYPEDIDVIFSSLSTTRGDAKGFANQKQIDLDLNMELIKAAQVKKASKVIIVTSFNNALISRIFPYFSLKKTIENSILSLNYSSTLILRPGPLVGDRTCLKSDVSFASKLSSEIAAWTYNTPCSSLLGFSIKDDEVINSAMYYLDNQDHVKIVTSEEMFGLSAAMEGI